MGGGAGPGLGWWCRPRAWACACAYNDALDGVARSRQLGFCTLDSG